MKTIDTVETAIIPLGAVLGIANIESFLGIILLSIQVILIIAKCIILINTKLKEKDTKGAVKVIEDTIDEIDIIKKEGEDLCNKKDGQQEN